MPTFENPEVDANEVQAALRALAYATRRVEDPRQIYSVLGSLTAAVASLSQCLHQLGEAHDNPMRPASWAPSEGRAGRAAAYRVSWELHRAAEMLRQVGDVIAIAHSTESTITYIPRNTPARCEVPLRGKGPGMSL